ncbi:MAG: YceI family protein [Proteobacteria bacterium]|nr:YceI family protein [Pseudomonadota bacterium]
MLKKQIILSIFILLFAINFQPAEADVLTFDFNDPKGVNSMNIFLDSTLEPITGFASGITGSVSIDMQKRKGLSGKITVESGQITLANKTMTNVLHSDEWINVNKFPLIEFTFKKIVRINKQTDTFADLIVSGDFMLKGIIKEMEIPVTLTWFQDKLASRNRTGNGDLLVLRATFKIDRTAFDIKPDMDFLLVSKDIEITAGIVGYAKKD